MKKVMAIAVMAVSVLSVQAQTKKPGGSAYASESFDAMAETIPVNFKGHDCRVIASALKKLDLKKDEFESSAKYKDRIDSIQGVNFSKNLNLDSILIFKRKGLVNPWTEYNADTEKLTVDLSVRRSSAFAIGSNPALMDWDSIEISEARPRFYTASNSFGVSVRVEERRFKTCAIAFANKYYGARGGAKIEAGGISPEVARRAKNGVSVFYVGKLAAPYIGHISEPSPPTIDSPVDVNWEGDALVFKLQQVIVADPKTGEILGREQISD